MNKQLMDVCKMLISQIEEGLGDAFSEDNIRGQLASSPHQKARLGGMMESLSEKLSDADGWLRAFPQDAHISGLLQRRAVCEERVVYLQSIINSY